MPRPIAACLTHHKCASDWALRVLNQLAAGTGLRIHHTHWPLRLPYEFEEQEPWKERIAGSWNFACQGDYDLLLATNADIENVRRLAARGFAGFYIIKDPRDIVVSGYYSHLESHYVDPLQNPWLAIHRKDLQERSKEDGLLAELEYSSHHINRIRNWEYGYGGILESRFETVTPNPSHELARLLAHTGILLDGWTAPPDSPLSFRIPRELWDSIMEANTFQALTAGRSRGEESRGRHLRSGLSGDWKNHFTPAVLSRFKELYPGIIASLAYAPDDSW